MSNGECPSSRGSRSAPFLIGKNSHGNWVVRDPSGRHGGLFIDRVHALKYAMWENGNHPQAVIMVPDGLELDMSIAPGSVEEASGNSQAQRKRVA